MGSALRILRTEYLPAQLRAFTGKCRYGAQVRRVLALALVLEGCPRTQAASRHGAGPAPALTEQQMTELKALELKDPDPATN